MSRESFNQLMNQYSSEAETQQREEARLAARAAKREKVKHVLIGTLVLTLCVYVAAHNNEIRDRVAKMFPSKEPEYRQVLAVADDTLADKSGNAPADPAARSARLKQALMNAKNHAAVLDNIMDDSMDKHGTAPAPAKKK